LEKVKEENESLNSNLLKEREKFNLELRIKDSIYDRDVSQANIKNETLKHQNDMFLNVKKLNDILYLKNNELKKCIEELKEGEKIKLDKIEIRYNKKFDNYKRKMIDLLKKNEEASSKLGAQAELNSKLKILHIQELINELEIQGVEVEDLLKERQELKLKIMELNHDLFIYKKVIDTMTKKNNKFQNKLKKISNNIKEYKLLSFSQSKYNKEKKIITEPNEKSINIKEYNITRKCSVNDKNILKIIENKNLLTTSSKKSMPSFENNKIKLKKNDIENKNFNKTTLNFLRPNTNNDMYKIKEAKNYEIIYKEKEKFKDLYEFYKEKYDSIKRQYSNIFNIYNNALEKIYNEEIVKINKENIMININEFKEFKFENMNSEQKYAILVKLINSIAPLVYKKDIEDNLFNQNVSKIKEKYNFNGINSISIFTIIKRLRKYSNN
jgi:myosin heavy subunit